MLKHYFCFIFANISVSICVLHENKLIKIKEKTNENRLFDIVDSCVDLSTHFKMKSYILRALICCYQCHQKPNTSTT